MSRQVFRPARKKERSYHKVDSVFLLWFNSRMAKKTTQGSDEDDELKPAYGRMTLDEWGRRLHVSYDELVSHVDEMRNRDANRPANRQTPQRSLLYSKKIAADMLAFLIEYQDTCQMTKAAETIGVTARTIRMWRSMYPLFSELCGDLQESMVDVAEDELYRRAVIGEDTNIYHQGAVVDVVKKKSDDLLKFLLNANRNKFRNKSEVSMTGANGGPIQIEETVNMEQLREKLFERLLTKAMVK